MNFVPQLVPIPHGDQESLLRFLVTQGIAVSGPDFFLEQFDVFSVDDARLLIQKAQSKPFEQPQRTFVLMLSGMTIEAQNALLKTFEEPPAHALFVVATPAPWALLSTLRSRMRLINPGNAEQLPSPIDPHSFIAATPEQRITLLKAILDTDERDTGMTLAFLSALEKTLARHPLSPEKRTAVQSVYRARMYASDKGSLLKPLLEQVALLVPRL